MKPGRAADALVYTVGLDRIEEAVISVTDMQYLARDVRLERHQRRLRRRLHDDHGGGWGVDVTGGGVRGAEEAQQGVEQRHEGSFQRPPA